MVKRIAAIVGAIVLSACHKAPDAEYLRDYNQAHDLIDEYQGNSARLDQAESTLTSLIERRPDLPHAHVEMSRIIMNRGHIVSSDYRRGALANAEAELNKAVALDPKFCDAHIVLGHLYFRERRYGDALKALDDADALACSSPWSLINRAQVDLDLQKFDDAAAALAKVPAANADSPPAQKRTIQTRALSAQIWIAFSKGNQEEMIARTREQLALVPPDNAWDVGNASVSFQQAGAFEDAIETAREALRRMHYGAAEHSLGVALYGDSLWRSSRVKGTVEDSKAKEEWAEAESLVSFADAGKILWGSLANRDVAFRSLLQTKLTATQPDRPASTSR